ncbi:MAG: hypothetical protein ACKVZJ_07490 [Phycisphaerales bacterium]
MGTGSWSFWVSNLDVVVYLLVIGAAVWYGLLRDRSRGRKRCPKCWYDMNGVATLTCPECGRTHQRERELHRTRWHARPLAIGALACLAFFALSNWSSIRQGLWVRLVPSWALYVLFEPDYFAGNASPLPTLAGAPGGVGGIGPLVADPAQPWWEAKVEPFRVELARRHVMGELPDWMWRGLSTRGYTPPPDPMSWFFTRAKWPRGKPLVFASSVMGAWEGVPNVARIDRDYEWTLGDSARGLLIPGWPAWFDSGTPRSFGPPVRSYVIDTRNLPIGTVRLPIALACVESTPSGRGLELWRYAGELHFEIVDPATEILTPVGDQALTDAVRQATKLEIEPSPSSRGGFTVKFSLGVVEWHEPVAAAFRFVFLDGDRVIGTADDGLHPSTGGAVAMAPELSDAEAAFYRRHNAWTSEAISRLTVRVESRSEACLPQVWHDRCWRGSFVVRLLDHAGDLPAGPPEP